MPRSDFPEQHLVVFRRKGLDGKRVVHELHINIPRKTVIAAEAGDIVKQEDVIQAVETRFRRRFPTVQLTTGIVWSSLVHPIQPTTPTPS